MKYFSTRGGDELLSFEEAVLTGLAPNGGLYIPESIPELPKDWEEEWKEYSFTQLSHAILSLFISPNEISSEELQTLINKSYATFRHKEITPSKRIEQDDGTVLYVLELWHGPTFAFKDVALQLLGNLFEFFLIRRNERLRAEKERNGEVLKEEDKDKLTVVGATSGDTGSAAIYGLRNKENLSIFILHPKGRVSPIQEAQMTTITDPNVHNIAVKGTFDDCQDIVKALFSDKEFNATHKLGAINSINWARILAQTVYYFLAYFSVKKQLASSSPSATLQFVVPTGNFGDVLAGYYAKRMGLPMAKLGVGTNENDILARFWRSGRYERVAIVGDAEGAAEPVLGSSDGQQTAETPGVKETLSPAMDIMVSSNFERLLWYLGYEATSIKEDTASRRAAASATLAGWMSKVKSDGRVLLPVEVLEFARRDFVAERISDPETLTTIQSFFTSKTTPYVVDPHTAVGLAAAKIISKNPDFKYPSVTQVVLSTAHPAKFSEAVTRALSQESAFNFEQDVLPAEFKGLLDRPRRVIDVERPEVELVKRVIEKYTETKVNAGESSATGSV